MLETLKTSLFLFSVECNRWFLAMSPIALSGKFLFMEDEIWKDAVGYEGKYRISSKGNVIQNYWDGGKHTGEWIQKKYCCNKFGRPQVVFCKYGKLKSYLLSRLMGQLFMGLDINNRKICVCHKDDDPKNNNLDNLFLGTHKENSEDMVKKNRQGGFKNKGANNGMSKYSEELINLVKYMLKNGVKARLIHQVYGISEPHLSNLKHNIRR